MGARAGTISIRGLSKTYATRRARTEALRGIDLEIAPGEFIVVLGRSGCGKSTLLRALGGLLPPSEGGISIDGRPLYDARGRADDGALGSLGFVFQEANLLAWRSVWRNIALPLEVLGVPREERRARAMALAASVGLEAFADHLPRALSGGMRQRVAICRALAADPSVLLLDEPFGALDAKVRKELRRWLRRLHDELHVTSIFVTHDQEEALEVADRVVLMNHGRIEQVGSPREVWEHPATPFVASFLGGVPLVGDGTRPLRPHELQIQRLLPGQPVPAGAVTATLRRALVLDPVVRLELEPSHGERELIEARLATAAFEQLGLREGDAVLVSPRNSVANSLSVEA